MNAGRAVRTGVVLAVAVSTLAVARSAQAVPAMAAACSSGTHSLSEYRDHVYPETGNGGYRSIHTDVTMVYDAGATSSCAATTCNLPSAPPAASRTSASTSSAVRRSQMVPT